MCFILSWVSGLCCIWFLVIQAVSDMGPLLWHGPQVGSVIGWPLPKVLHHYYYPSISFRQTDFNSNVLCLGWLSNTTARSIILVVEYAWFSLSHSISATHIISPVSIPTWFQFTHKIYSVSPPTSQRLFNFMKSHFWLLFLVPVLLLLAFCSGSVSCANMFKAVYHLLFY